MNAARKARGCHLVLHASPGTRLLWPDRIGAHPTAAIGATGVPVTLWEDRSVGTAPDTTAVPVDTDRVRRVRRRVVRVLLVLVAVVVLVVGASVAWAYIASGGHRYTAADAPSAPVVIVLGARLHNDRPMAFLAGRLDVTAQLVRDGKARVVLISGDAGGTSGNETAAMTTYLVERGVDASRIVADPYGLDTYDSCARAVQVYGVRRALLVSQSYHLPRAVMLCRSLGMDADGVDATCPDCRDSTLARNRGREWFACVGGVTDAIRKPEPQVLSTPDSAASDALNRS